jgi:hypothetical protein
MPRPEDVGRTPFHWIAREQHPRIADFDVDDRRGHICATVAHRLHTVRTQGDAMTRSSLIWTPLALVALAGCPADEETDTETGDTDTDTDTDAGTAMLRVVHASPDAPAVDVYIAGVPMPVLEDFAYGDASDYVTIPAGAGTIELRAAGAASDSEPAYTQDVTFAADTTATAMAIGSFAGAGDAFRIAAFAEGFDAATAGNARVRVVHASPGAPAVAIDVGNDGTPELSDVAFGDESGAAGVALPSGEAIAIGIWAGSPLGRVTAFTTPALADGAELFVVATGLLTDLPRAETGFSLLVIDGDSGTAFVKQDPVVYALHAGSDAPAVDVFAGPTELTADLAYGEISGKIQVPPGTYTLDLFATAAGSTRPAGDPAASFTTPSLAAGGQYLAIPAGRLSVTGEFRLIAFGEGFDAEADEAALAVVHASPNAPTVDVGTVASNTLTAVAGLEDLSFGDSSAAAGVALPAGTYDLGLGADGSAPVLSFSDVGLTAGDRIIAVAAGEVGDNFQLWLVDTTAPSWTATAVDPDGT